MFRIHDGTNGDSVMFVLIHSIESFDQKYSLYDTLKELAKSLPLIIPHAKGWARTIHKRILNNEQTFQVYIEVVKLLEENLKNNIKEIITEIKTKNPKQSKEKADKFLGSI